MYAHPGGYTPFTCDLRQISYLVHKFKRQQKVCQVGHYCCAGGKLLDFFTPQPEAVAWLLCLERLLVAVQ